MLDWLKWLNPANWPVFQDPPSNYVKRPLSKGLQGIPPGALILFRDHGKIADISIAGKFGNPIAMLNIKDLGSLFAWAVRVAKKQWANHAGLYFGSGQHETVEAEYNGVVKDTLDKSTNDYTQLKIYVYLPLTVAQLSGLKGYAYGSIGKHYAYGQLLNALTPQVEVKDPGAKDEVFCSGLLVLAFRSQGIDISGKEAGETSPGDIDAYLSRPEARADGWVLWDLQNVRGNIYVETPAAPRPDYPA